MKDLYTINNKSANELKTLINTYVDSVIVYDDKVDINLTISFVHMYGGGGGCRTHVRKQ
ncbi:hypothetical protein [Clostridium sp. DJ247]|uniref:hypothetical protein n=1 Tax=Clostridium sp. DJ247 TaxID=2726188 RepID=UPI00162568FA|nr:hypothetical protein [Clostridium sp. DJ247]